MTIALAHRLAQSGALPPRVIEQALLTAHAGRLHLIRVIADMGPGERAALESVLAQSPINDLQPLRVDRTLVRRLPVGLCERLLAVPAGADPESGVVQVAAVDPDDPHVASEFTYQLGAPVQLLRARYDELTAALAKLQATVSQPHMSQRLTSSNEPPLPRASAPSSHSSARGTGRSAESSSWQVEFSRTDFVSEFTARLESAKTAAEVLEHVTLALTRAAPRALILAAREGQYEGVTGTPSLDLSAVRSVRAAAEGSVVTSATAAGYYLGRFKSGALDQLLSGLLRVAASEEVYALPIWISGKPALVVVAAGLDSPLEATRLIDEVARAAGSALERLLRNRKRR